MNIFYALRHRAFTFIWGGQTISRLGDSLYQISLAWWVLEKTGSAATMGTVLILTTIPLFLFLLIGGAVVDRFSRLQVMLHTDIGRGIIITLVAILAWNNMLEIWHVYLASLFLGWLTAFFRPAYSAIIPELMPQDTLPSANSLTALGWQLTGILGPVLGALMVAQGSSATVFLLDAITFFVAALCLLPLRGLSASPNSRPNRNNILLDIREGFVAVIGIPWLWRMIIVSSLINLMGRGPINVSLPFLVQDSLQADVDSLGILYSIFAIGSVIGAVWMGQKTQIRGKGLVMYSMFTVVGLMTGAMGLPIGFPAVAIAFLILGIALAIANLSGANALQQYVPQALYGRVTSISSLGIELVLPLSFSLAGWTTDHFSASFTFIAGGILTAMIAWLGLLHPAIRSLD